MKSKITKLTSPSHDLVHEIQESRSSLSKLNDEVCTDVMDRDLILLIQTEKHDKPVVMLEKSEKSQAALVSFIPSFQLEEQKVELIFLVDRSGSMGGSSMEQAKKALTLFLHSMPSDCYFNIWSFGSRFSSLFDNNTSKLYDDQSLLQAKNHVQAMHANYGGTEVYSPFDAIFKTPTIEGYARQIFLLTDGDVSNAPQVMSLVKKNGSSSRVFTLGLGMSASRHLVKGVARSGNGLSIFASLEEDLRPKVLSLLKNSLMPSLTNVEVLWNDEQSSEQSSGKNPILNKARTLMGFNKPLEDEPEVILEMDDKPGPLFDGSRMLEFKIFPKDKALHQVTIKAQAPDGPLSLTIPIEDKSYLSISSIGNIIHKLAARRRIQSLQENLPLFYSSKDMIEKEIEALALEHAIASQFTSFVGVDKQTRKTVLEPAMTSRQIQQEVPRGFGSFTANYMSFAAPRGGVFGAAPCAAPLPMMAMAQQQQASFGGGVLRSSRMKRSNFQADCLVTDSAVTDGMIESDFGTEMADAKPELDPLTQLIDLQNANGSFKLGHTIFEDLTGLKEEELKARQPKDCKLDLWITAVAIAALDKKFAKDKELWSLVKSKAEKFLKSQTDCDCEGLLKAALELF